MSKANPLEPRPVDEEIQRELREFVRDTVSLRRAFILYGRGNVMLAKALKRWRAITKRVFPNEQTIELTVAGKNLFVGYVLLEREGQFVKELIENMRRLIIRRLSLRIGLEEDELYTLMEMLSLDARTLLMKGGPASFIADRNIRDVQVIENVYVKQVSDLKKIDLEGERVDIEELRLIKQQLMNLISLSRKGIELRREERELFADLGRNPTFMGELVRETVLKELRELGLKGNRACGERMSEIFELLLSVMRQVPACDRKFMGNAFSEALEEIDETIKLEVLGAQFRTAGGLPQLLDDKVFECSSENVAEFILDTYQEGGAELKGVAYLLKKLLPSESVLKGVVTQLRSESPARGVDITDLERLLKEQVGLYFETVSKLKTVQPKEARSRLKESIARLNRLGEIVVDRAELSGFLKSGAETEIEEETLVISELLTGGEATIKLARRAAGRIMELVDKGSGETAYSLFSSLLKQLKSRDDALVKEVRTGLMELCKKGYLHSILVALPDAEKKTSLIAGLLKSMPREDLVLLWGDISGDGNLAVREALVETARREPETVAGLLRLQVTDGAGKPISGLADIMSGMPPEVSLPILKDLCGQSDPAVRLKAVSVLGRIGGARALPLLLVMVEDTDSEVRCTTIPLLGHSGGKEGVEKLLEIAGDEGGAWDMEERALACRALSKCRSEEAIPIMVKILKSKRWHRRGMGFRALRASARFALETIGGPARRSLPCAEALAKEHGVGEGKTEEALERETSGRRTLIGRLFRKISGRS